MIDQKKHLEYKWIVLGICFLMEFICLGFCSSNAGLYTVAVTQALNIKRSVYALTGSIRYIVQVITALYFGTLVQRFGTKKMVCLGLTSLFASVIIRAFATQYYHLYIGGALWGFGMVFSGGTMASTIVRQWFHEDIGKYTGIVMSANGIGGAVAAQIITPIINNGEAFGYRKAYLLSAGITLAITVILLIFLREQANAPDAINANTKKASKGALWVGMEYTTARKKMYFYAAAVLIFLTGISLQSIGSITIVYMTDLGLSSGFIAATATISSLTLTFSKILVGYTYDKRGLRFALLICQFSAIIAFTMKGIMTNSTIGMILAIIATVLSNVALPLETVMIPLLTNDLFGSASYHKVLGIYMAMNSLGLCLGSPLGDLYYDIFGTYKPCFWFFVLLMVVTTVAFQFVIYAANKDKKAILAVQKV